MNIKNIVSLLMIMTITNAVCQINRNIFQELVNKFRLEHLISGDYLRFTRVPINLFFFQIPLNRNNIRSCLKHFAVKINVNISYSFCKIEIRLQGSTII